MRFLLTRDIRDNSTIRTLLGLYSLGLIIYLGLFPLIEHHNLGLSYAAVKSNVLGNPETFIRPMSLETLLEVTHIKLFTALVALITLLAAFVRLPISEKAKVSVMCVLFSAVLIDALMPFLVGSLGPMPLLVKVIAYWVWEVGLLIVSLLTLLYLIKPRRTQSVSPQ